MQADMQKAQEELAHLEVTGQAGGEAHLHGGIPERDTAFHPATIRPGGLQGELCVLDLKLRSFHPHNAVP